MNIALVGDKFDFLRYCIENNINTYNDDTKGQNGEDTYFCCNTISSAFGRDFDDAVYFVSAKDDVVAAVIRNIANSKCNKERN